jgi:CspA family cold shock protein
MNGKIARLVKDKGFGFIKAGGSDYFFHRSSVKGVAFEDLKEGAEVTFEEAEGAKGPRAEDVYLRDN